jgi:hypothetical protein
VPEVVIFFARPDVLFGLFTRANFDQATAHGAVAPFAAGCGSIAQYPYFDRDAENPSAFVSMFDASARPYVASDTLTFAAPMRKFVSMVRNMEESFLITPSWEKVRQRLRSTAPVRPWRRAALTDPGDPGIQGVLDFRKRSGEDPYRHAEFQREAFRRTVFPESLLSGLIQELLDP